MKIYRLLKTHALKQGTELRRTCLYENIPAVENTCIEAGDRTQKDMSVRKYTGC